jgi:glucose/arabinose dehydrogenase
LTAIINKLLLLDSEGKSINPELVSKTITPPSTWGRPVGLLVMPDGSMLFTEEANGIIYRIQSRSLL